MSSIEFLWLLLFFFLFVFLYKSLLHRLFIVTIDRKNLNFSWFIYNHKHSVVPVMPSLFLFTDKQCFLPFIHSFSHSFSHSIPFHAIQCLFVLVIRLVCLWNEHRRDLKKDRKRKFISLFEYFINGIINCCCYYCCCAYIDCCFYLMLCYFGNSCC